MKLIDRKTFLTLSPGTLYSEYQLEDWNNCNSISDLKIKGVTVGDFYYELKINDSVDLDLHDIYYMKLGDEIPIDLDENDIKSLIKVLQSSLESN